MPPVSNMKRFLIVPILFLAVGCVDSRQAYHDFIDGALTVYQDHMEYSFEESVKFLSFMDYSWQNISCSDCYAAGRNTAKLYINKENA